MHHQRSLRKNKKMFDLNTRKWKEEQKNKKRRYQFALDIFLKKEDSH